jgi:predicted negative regulator of RcsB-dependent stress response
MRKSVPLVCGFLAATAGLLAADPLAAGREALRNGFPLVAAMKIEERVEGLGTEEAGAAANLLYARALLESGQPGAARRILADGAAGEGSGRDFWLAQAMAAEGESAAALRSYLAASRDADFTHREAALLGAARMLVDTGEPERALELLEPIAAAAGSNLAIPARLELAAIELDLGDPGSAMAALQPVEAPDPRTRTMRDFLMARALADSGRNERALEILEGLVPLDASMASEATLLESRLLAEAGRLEDAEGLLEKFIGRHPDLPGLEPLFAGLDRIYAAAVTPSAGELARWAAEEQDTPRRKLAMFHLARLESRRNNHAAAVELLEQLAVDPASDPLADRTALELAELRIRLGRHDSALSILSRRIGDPAASFLRGLALAGKGEHSEAVVQFLDAATDSSFAESALFNAALCSLVSGSDATPFMEELAQRFPKSPRIDAFRLHEARELLWRGDAAGAAKMEELAREDLPATGPAASLALAEWKYRQLDLRGARLELQRISDRPDPAREASLRVFLADDGSQGCEDAVIAEARAFLASHAASPHAGRVRMKLGEALFRKGDFAAARVEFESLARDEPDSAMESAALFLAAQAASRIPSASSPGEAILLYEEVAAKGGETGARARIEQAGIHASRGNPAEANLILDRVASAEVDPDLRAAAMMEKGKNFYAMGEADKANYLEAVRVWKQIAQPSAFAPAWRNQALCRIGSALEKTGDPDGAVAAYYDVFKPSGEPLPEFFWFHKAGFAAARILESQGRWEEAIRVYKIMADAEGPRSLEARNRIRKISLENFLWEP